MPDEFIKYNIYVTGIQGSGKTTYTEKLYNKNKQKIKGIIHLDDFWNLFYNKDYKVSEDIKKFIGNKKLTNKNIPGLTAEFIKYSSKNINGYIIEGVQLLDCVDLLDLSKNKLILIDIEKDKLLDQSWDRDKDRIDELLFDEFVNNGDYNSYVKAFNKNYNKYIKFVNDIKELDNKNVIIKEYK